MTDDLVIDVSYDWVLACDVQRRSMQGLGGSQSLDCSARCRQVRALGGDCYDFVPLAGNRVGLVVGDASGKGLAAALMIASIQSSLRMAALFTGNDLVSLVRVVNYQAYCSSAEDRYATLFCAIFDGLDRTLRYVNAGHTPPVVIRRDGSLSWLESTGAPVGMFPDSTYQERSVRVERGDISIAYTDGLTECAKENGEEWGVHGMVNAAREAAKNGGGAEELVTSIFNCMDQFSNELQRDDATLLVARVL